LQLELNKQENVRLKAQVDHLSRSLEETRTTLTEVRGHGIHPILETGRTNALLNRSVNTQQEPLRQQLSTLSYLSVSINSTFCAKATPPFDPNATLIESNPRVWRKGCVSLQPKWNL